MSTKTLMRSIRSCKAIASMVFRERDFYQRIDVVRSLKDKPVASDRETSFDQFCADHEISAREKNVLELLVKDMTYLEISEELFVSPGTIRVHVSNIYRKFGVHSKAELFEKMGSDTISS